jgi:EmrB/QacA subfamily drug resistance transporter
MSTTEQKTKRAALLISALSAFLITYMGSSTNIALPTIAKEFSMNAVLLSWVATAYLLSAAIFLVPFGKAADIYGRKKILGLGLIIYTSSSFISAFAFSGIMLIILRAIQGIGGSMIFGTGIAILTSVFPKNERGKAIGFNLASVYLGLSLGPFLGGMLTHYFGWRSIFLFNIPIGVLAIILLYSRLKGEWADAKGDKLDLIGSFTYLIGMIAIIYGFSQLPGRIGIILLIFGWAAIYIFIRLELKLKNPVLNLSLFKNNRTFLFSNMAALINYSATYAVTFLLSLYLQYVKLLSPQEAGIILVAQPVLMTIVSLFSGRLSDKIESRIIASVGMALTVVGLAMLIVLNENTSIQYVVICLVILGTGFGLFASPNTNSIMSSVENRYYGVASAMMGTMRLTGQMFSMGIATLVISVLIGRVQLKLEYHTQLILCIKTVIIINVFLCTLGVFASLARGKMHK